MVDYSSRYAGAQQTRTALILALQNAVVYPINLILAATGITLFYKVI
jgi:type II secretory pathway component PulF